MIGGYATTISYQPFLLGNAMELYDTKKNLNIKTRLVGIQLQYFINPILLILNNTSAAIYKQHKLELCSYIKCLE